MKIAITSQGDQLDSVIDQRFGRCSYFVIYDTESKTTQFIQNPNKIIEEGWENAIQQTQKTHHSTDLDVV